MGTGMGVFWSALMTPVLALWLLASPCAAQDAVPESFRDAFIIELREKSPDTRVEPTPDGAIVFGPLGENRIGLGNAWRRVNAGEDATAVLEQMVDVALTSEYPKYDPQTAFVLVRPLGMIAPFLNSGDENDAPLFRPLAGDLVLTVAQDLGDRFVFLPRLEIGADETAWSAAWDAADKRTKDSLGDVEVLYGGQGLGFISAREDITASLLMIDGVWDEDLVKIVGPAIAVIPLKTLLIIANADDREAMKELMALMPEVDQDPDGMTGYILIRRDRAWNVITP